MRPRIPHFVLALALVGTMGQAQGVPVGPAPLSELARMIAHLAPLKACHDSLTPEQRLRLMQAYIAAINSDQLVGQLCTNAASPDTFSSPSSKGNH